MNQMTIDIINICQGVSHKYTKSTGENIVNYMMDNGIYTISGIKKAMVLALINYIMNSDNYSKILKYVVFSKGTLTNRIVKAFSLA